MINLSFSLYQYDAAIAKLVGEIKTGLDKTDPLLGQIQSHSIVHRGAIRQVSEPEVVDTKMRDFRQDITADLDMFRKTNVDEFVVLLWGLWKSLASQAKKHMFDVLSQTTEAVGNSVALQAGMNIWDAQIEMLKQMEMRFDEEGNHNIQIVLHPNTYRKLAENPPTPEQEQKWEDTIKAKREEYYAQKRTRRLS